MNRQELIKLVAEDKKKKEQELYNKTKERFYGVLKIEPDSIDVTDIRHTSGYIFEDFIGYKCTLDGANFYCGIVFPYPDGKIFTAIYQEIIVKTMHKRWFKTVYKETKEYVRIRRLSDIVVYNENNTES